jgi:hypothetical protein
MKTSCFLGSSLFRGDGGRVRNQNAMSHLASLCILLIVVVSGCSPSPIQDMEASTAAAEQRLRTLKETSDSGALEVEAEALRQSEEALALEKRDLARQFEAQLQTQGWRPLIRGNGGSIERYVLMESVKTVEPGTLWIQTMTISSDQTMTFQGFRLRPGEKSWAPADKPGRAVQADGYKIIEGTPDAEAMAELTREIDQ